MARINPGHTQKKRLLEANAKVGLHLHHIDEDSSNTVDENLAVLCVEDHDRHHRPGSYRPQVNHRELGPDLIRQHKMSWETFVLEAQQPNPKIVATLAAYGTVELIHSLQLVMQWPDERIEYTRSYHLLDGTPDKLTDAVMEELSHIGQNVKLMVLNEPLPVDHCPCCGAGVSRTVKPAVIIRHTDPDWPTDSSCMIYINPETPSITLQSFLREEQLLLSTLHLCRGKFLHYHDDDIDERLAVQPDTSIRTQATRIVKKLLSEWSPAKVFIGTGDPDAPQLIDELDLPAFWEIGRR